MAQPISQIAKTEQYRRYRVEGVSAEDAIARVRAFGAFRAVAIQACEEATRSLARRSA